MAIKKDTGWKKNPGSQPRDEIRRLEFTSHDENVDGSLGEANVLELRTYEQTGKMDFRWRGQAKLVHVGELFRVYAQNSDEVKAKIQVGLRMFAQDILEAIPTSLSKPG